MKADRDEVRALADELYKLGSRLYEIAARLADEYTEDQRTCPHDAPLIRKSVIDGIPADQALQIMVRCPKCGAGTSLAGYIPKDDDYFRRSFFRPQ